MGKDSMEHSCVVRSEEVHVKLAQIHTAVEPCFKNSKHSVLPHRVLKSPIAVYCTATQVTVHTPT